MSSGLAPEVQSNACQYSYFCVFYMTGDDGHKELPVTIEHHKEESEVRNSKKAFVLIDELRECWYLFKNDLNRYFKYRLFLRFCR